MTVDGYRGQRPPPSWPSHYWKLSTNDSRHERNPPSHLHTVDIYFWTTDDAEAFVGNVKRILQHDQVSILDLPSTSTPHDKVISPVVQKLENVAIQDPAYHNIQNRIVSDVQVSPASNQNPNATDSAAFQPLAYNPAAPAAPEPIRHREKTPPPDDADTGTGLAAAAHADQAHAHSPLSRPPYAGSPPTQAYHPPYTSPTPGGYVSPIPSATGQRVSSVLSFPPPPPQSPPGSTSASNQQLVPAFSPPPSRSPEGQYLKDVKHIPSPGSQILGNSYIGGLHQPLQHVQPQYADYLDKTGHSSPGPANNYSQYSYSPQPSQQQPQQLQPAQNSQYDVHSQVYRPTEEEAKYDKRSRPSDAGPGQQPRKLEQQAAKVDKGVNRLFKKLEKRIG